MSGASLLLLLLACKPPVEDTAVEVEPVCGSSTDLLDAPVPIGSDIGQLAPLDLLDVATTATVQPDGTVTFETRAEFGVGELDGWPTFDFAPRADRVSIDGQDIDSGLLTRVGVRDPVRTVTAIDVELERCSTHVLEASYTVDKDWFRTGDQPRIEPRDDGIFWSGGLSDGEPDHYVSMWMPGNLLFDRFPIELTVTLVGEDRPHRLDANAPVTELGDHSWSVAYPATNQAHSPFWALFPESMPHHSATAQLAAGPITVDVYKRPEDPVDMEAVGQRAVLALEEYDTTMGAYAHGDRYIVWLWHEDNASMEYGGATITRESALEHEILHSWWARGVTPMADHHGWFDEAITQWGTGPSPFYASQVIPVDNITMVIGEDEWAAAALNPLHYALGASVFAGIADRHGVDAELVALAAMYDDRAIGPARTQDVERHLYCWFDGDEYVRNIFHAQVYGGEGIPPAVDPRWCD